MRIRSDEGSGPEAETLVLCPCCGKGMVSPTLAQKVARCLSDHLSSNPPPVDPQSEKE